MIAQSYDKVPENNSLLLDLPFREATGELTFDHAKPHHPLTFNDPGGGSFSWATLASGLSVLEFVAVGVGFTDGVYLKSLAADTLDLNFIAGSYSLGGWVKWSWNGHSSIWMGRYGVDLDGWETYFDISGGRNTLSHRHHHSSLAPNNNSSCFSEDWIPGVWASVGISRTAGDIYPKHFRNGCELEMSYQATGMLDPDACARSLRLGSRYTGDANWYKGQMWGPRVWNRALTTDEWLKIFERERTLFGI